MIKGRRVGTFTSGIILIVFGVMFLTHSMFKNINYNLIISLWPVMLILIGIEIIAAYIVNKEEKIRYDTGAVVIVMILCIFAMIMGAIQFVITNYPQFKIMF
ncbi:LiaI-LiaF-like domain-containing protein [Clostridium sp. WILCCON 0269]|uniref:LiaI-LiaF-like domain-containing protein n=1 Tax=Candidatus Clostridium eludens TaxID=3381663 RepID=A0ABW8SFY4_9CLOT